MRVSTVSISRLPVLAIALAAAAACSQGPDSPLSPSATAGAILSDTASGATLKVEAPVPLDPIGGAVVDDRKPVFRFSNSVGRFVVPGQGTYRIELYRGEELISEMGVSSDPAGGTSHAYPTELDWESNYSWRTRLELEGAAGPWSETVTFSTPVEPKATLGFAVPASCGPQSPPNGNRLGCAADVALVSSEWAGCRGGSGVTLPSLRPPRRRRAGRGRRSLGADHEECKRAAVHVGQLRSVHSRRVRRRCRRVPSRPRRLRLGRLGSRRRRRCSRSTGELDTARRAARRQLLGAGTAVPVNRTLTRSRIAIDRPGAASRREAVPLSCTLRPCPSRQLSTKRSPRSASRGTERPSRQNRTP